MIKRLWNKDDGGGSGGSAPKDNAIVLEIDGEQKTFDKDAVTRLVHDHATMSSKAEKIEKIVAAAARYDLDPEEYVANADGSFAVMNQLIEAGIIDQQGNIIKKGQDSPAPVTDTDEPTTTVAKGADGALLKAFQGLQSKVENLEKHNLALEEDLTGMMRLRLQDKLMTEFPGLNDEDVSQIFGKAMNDKSKPVRDHAKAYAESKEKASRAAIEAYAKKHGLNLEELEAMNKQNEIVSKGGAAALYEGKNFSFKKKDGAVSPRQAAKEFLEKNLGGN